MISIIIPIYNTAKYLNECFNSIKAQTYTDFEILMINDGSTDDSETICKNWTGYDSRFKYFYKENSGLSLTRNYGFSKANGNYIFYIDSDDIISPQTLEFLYKTLKKDNLDLVACYEYDFKDGNTPEIIKYEDVDFRKYLDSIDFLKTLAYEDLILARAWNKLYKRSLLEKVEFEDYVLEDRIFAIDLSLKLNKAAIIINKLIYHRFHENSIMTTPSSKIYTGMLVSCQRQISASKLIIHDSKEFRAINEQIIYALNRFAAGAHAEHFLKEEKELRQLTKKLYKEIGVNKLSLKLFLQIYFFPLWSFLSIKRNHIWIGGRNMRLAKK